MISFEPELHRLRPLLGDANTDALLARERREVFSLYPELRLVAWAGAMLLAAAAGLVLKNNLERIGPLALAMLMGVAAIACYAFVWWRRDRAMLVDDFILLLGALLVSGDVAFIESQFGLFGEAWYRHFLILAVVHAAGAYAFGSRTLLSLAITAFAGWLGIRGAHVFEGTDYAVRAFGCAAGVVMARVANRRRDFDGTYEHFAAILALLGGLSLAIEPEWHAAACLLTIAIAAAIIGWGFRTRREPFVLYAFPAAVIAADILLVHWIEDGGFVFFLMLLSTIGAIAALFVLHAKFKEAGA